MKIGTPQAGPVNPLFFDILSLLYAMDKILVPDSPVIFLAVLTLHLNMQPVNT